MSATLPTLRAIAALTEAQGYPPTLAELAAALGLSRTASAHARVTLLEDAGLVVRGGVRSLRVTASGSLLLSRDRKD